MRMRRNTARGVIVGIAGLAAIAFGTPGMAAAEVKTGWIGSTGPVNGVVYLHTSTIDNAAIPKASTRIYTAFGNTVAQGTMGSKHDCSEKVHYAGQPTANSTPSSLTRRTLK